MNNDNNLLLTILIGIVMFWIFNINTTEKFENNYSKAKNSNQSIEYYRADKSNEDENDSKRSKSPLLDQEIDDSALINQLYLQGKSSSRQMSSSSNGSPRTVSSRSSPRKLYANGVPEDPNQKIFKTPLSQQNNSVLESSYNNMGKPYNAQQEMYPNDNPIGSNNNNKGQNPYYNLKDESYLLLSKDSMPDDKFKKVIPSEPRQTLTSSQLLPTQKNNDWFQVPNEKFNLLQAVDLEIPEIKIGIDTVGQSRKNATYDLRTAPPNPKFVVSPWQNSTIEPDYNTKPLC